MTTGVGLAGTMLAISGYLSTCVQSLGGRRPSGPGMRATLRRWEVREQAQVLEAELGVVAFALVRAFGEREQVAGEPRVGDRCRRPERLAVEGGEALRSTRHALDVVAAHQVQLATVEQPRHVRLAPPQRG